ncbi:hypothetical protein JMJ58_07585 [Haloterrigena salifodinae]|uniref:Uncharacterized protein n=1 Tax=Haloterrigena salifodinae TaxID=2675099 RepID=A0A8T8E5Z9_9EURY|nr:hypothetical protein [Haloterrigena salifodinae]QRV16721.1 hypothetical protein JMJ58_07585 [Haloterrigena salifodinae]
MSADRLGDDPTPARVDPSDQWPAVPLSARIERTQLELRVAALEERAASDGTSRRTTSRTGGAIPRLVAVSID